jgi:tetratricopeptide (TPR) repeat protein
LALAHSRVRLARVLTNMGRFETAETELTDTLPALESSGLPRLLGVYFSIVAHLKLMTGDFASARTHLEKGSTLFHEAKNKFDELQTQGAIADVAWALGDLVAAEAALRENIAIRRKSATSRKGSLGFALANLAGVLTECGEIAEALEAAREALPLLSGVGNAWIFMDHFALRAALAGNVVMAARVAGYADAAYAAKECSRQPNETRAHTRLRALLRERLDPVEFERLLAKGAKMTEDEACRMALED